MNPERRKFLTALGAVSANAALTGCATEIGERNMYGLISKITATAGERDALARILVEGVAGMPGCLSYVVANDAADSDSIWVTEVWDEQSSHQASLSLPSVLEAISRGRPLIAGFGERIETSPIGGHGLET